MNILIEPIQYGPKQAVLAEIYFNELALFNDGNYCFKIYIKDSATNLLDTRSLKVPKEEYISMGENKDERATGILLKENIVRETPPKIP